VTLGAALWLAAAGLAALAWTRLALLGLLTQARLDRLGDGRADPPAGGWPRLTVVVPCRDEAANVEAAVRSLLAQDYPDLEVVAVDDRSTDGTDAILDRLRAAEPRLAVIHVTDLPPGWLGKNHACHVGAERARGRFVLFADGDVVFAQGAIRRAVAYAEWHRLGHLVALPRLVAHGFGERAFVTGFAAIASYVFRVWELRRPRTGGFIGVGAFNLLRRDDYLRVGGHRRLALEVVDDAKLGLVLRRSGVRQGAVDSAGLVQVRWQAGLVRSVGGLVKNGFAGAEYRWSVALAAASILAFLSLAPLAAALWAPLPSARLLGLYGYAVSVAIHGTVARRFGGGSGVEGLLQPLAGLSLGAVHLASAAVTTCRRGIVWRGTRYPLDALRAGCVRAADWPVDGAVGWE
jgi:glycosyltransferase involved in cell wall biosynthesis